MLNQSDRCNQSTGGPGGPRRTLPPARAAGLPGPAPGRQAPALAPALCRGRMWPRPQPLRTKEIRHVRLATIVTPDGPRLHVRARSGYVDVAEATGDARFSSLQYVLESGLAAMDTIRVLQDSDGAEAGLGLRRGRPFARGGEAPRSHRRFRGSQGGLSPRLEAPGKPVDGRQE